MTGVGVGGVGVGGGSGGGGDVDESLTVHSAHVSLDETFRCGERKE